MIDRENGVCGRQQLAGDSFVGLTSAVYSQLRQMAASRMAQERDPQTLQATALVHEAWLRLGGEHQPDWTSRDHFFSAVAHVMRCILVDRARYRQSVRHGGGQRKVELDAWNWELIDPVSTEIQDATLLALNEAMEKFETLDAETAKLVQLHYFAGLNVAESAEVMSFSLRTTERRLAYARAWLGREVKAIRSAR